jgi:hypothetical protein
VNEKADLPETLSSFLRGDDTRHTERVGWALCFTVLEGIPHDLNQECCKDGDPRDDFPKHSLVGPRGVVQSHADQDC